MILSILYLLSIVGVNFGFANTNTIDTLLGPLPPMTFIVGGIFVLRDFVQRKIGHYVLLIMVISCIISYWTSNPTVAYASITAFAFAELSDWIIYTTIKKEFRYRVLYSSFIGVFIDTIIFLPMINMFSWSAVLIMYLSKMLAAVIVFILYRYKNDSLPRSSRSKC